MTEQTVVADQIRAKAAEVDDFLKGLTAAGPLEERYMASARRDIAGGFTWAERAVMGDAQPGAVRG